MITRSTLATLGTPWECSSFRRESSTDRRKPMSDCRSTAELRGTGSEKSGRTLTRTSYPRKATTASTSREDYSPPVPSVTTTLKNNITTTDKEHSKDPISAVSQMLMNSNSHPPIDSWSWPAMGSGMYCQRARCCRP